MHCLQRFCSPIASLTGSPLFKCFSLQPSIIWVAYGLCVHNHVVLRTDILVEVVESRLWLCNVCSVLCSVSMLYATHCVPCAVCAGPGRPEEERHLFYVSTHPPAGQAPLSNCGLGSCINNNLNLSLMIGWFSISTQKYILLFYQYILYRL